MNRVAKVARIMTWGIFLLVSLLTAGLNLPSEHDPHIAGMLRNALFFSGIPVVAAAEFHIQRFELKQNAPPAGLALILVALLASYFVISFVALFTDIATSWGILLSWFFTFVGLFSLPPNAQQERRLLLGSITLLIAGIALLRLLSLWLWPEFFYNYLKPGNLLKWTPYCIAALGLIFWCALLAFNNWVKRAARLFAQGRPR